MAIISRDLWNVGKPRSVKTAQDVQGHLGEREAMQEISPFLRELFNDRCPEIQKSLEQIRTRDERTIQQLRPLRILRRRAQLLLDKFLKQLLF
jgi:hypothetical protein